ncbi:MAG: NUDIX domain-containing protein [bacterium]|nr:NUDIX domain-containing protein [bacterium]MDZ4299439.1 NUDIX domain-containing protein [Candidatus Sungbacteria bacterium]
MEKIIKVGIQGIILDNLKKKVLLGKRKNCFGAGSWGLPGGHLEFGESFEEAIAREILEETGLIAQEVKVFGVFNTRVLPASHHIQIGCFVEVYKGVPRIVEPDKCEVLDFYDLDALPKAIFISSQPILDEFRKNRSFQ